MCGKEQAAAASALHARSCSCSCATSFRATRSLSKACFANRLLDAPIFGGSCCWNKRRVSKGLRQQASKLFHEVVSELAVACLGARHSNRQVANSIERLLYFAAVLTTFPRQPPVTASVLVSRAAIVSRSDVSVRGGI